MRTALGLILTVLGAGIMLYGIGAALVELIDLYQSTMADPLNQPEGGEAAVSSRMIRSLLIGAAGIPALLIGSLLLRVSILQRIGRRRAAR
jgi:hypothetical protein